MTNQSEPVKIHSADELPPNTVIEAALFYAERGHTVFPVPPGEKKSYKSRRFSNGQNWGQTRVPDEIRRDFSRWPNANIGLPTGSGTGFFVIEADTLEGHNVDGIASLADLQETFGPLPPTRTARSPSGSMHYYFNLPSGLIVNNSASLIAIGVDVRGEGGMVVAPPSVKPGCGRYEWYDWRGIADSPFWLIDLCQKKVSKTLEVVRAKGEEPPDLEKIFAAVAAIPNDDLGWDEWNRIAMAIYAAFDGSDAGYEALTKWSQKCAKFDEAGTKERWAKLRTSPPDQIGVGTLMYHADIAVPGWRAPFAKGDTAAKEELSAVCDALLACDPDNRDELLNEAAYSIGQLVGARRLHEQTARLRLRAAGVTLGYTEVVLDAVIASGMARGRNKPRLPIIKVHGGSISRNIDCAEIELIKSGEPIFQRAGRSLVKPYKYELPAADGKMTEVIGLAPIVAENLIFYLNKRGAIFRRFDKRSRDWVDINPPYEIASGLLHKNDWKFNNIAGVITYPTMLPDGRILQREGYEPTTQLYYSPDKYLKVPEIKNEPTRGDALSALAMLKGLLVEFPFETALDEAVALAAMMTPVLRGAYWVAPPFLFNAHQAGTGKSHLVNVISTIATGKSCPVSIYSENEEENIKALGANILRGVGIVSLDNCSRDLGGDFLAQMTEQRSVSIRVLGKSETIECEWGGTFLATGNNVGWKADMTRRGLVCKLDAQLERPENRVFTHDPIKMISQDRGDYVAAILTIARAYRVANQPVGCDGFASYEAWSRAVREPLIWLGQADPKRSQDASTEEDTVRGAIREFFTHWRRPGGLLVGVGYTARQIIDKASERVPGGDAFELVNPELHDLLKMQAGDIRGSIDGKKLAVWLRNIKGQIYDNHRIVLVRASNQGNRYALEAGGTDGGWRSSGDLTPPVNAHAAF